MLPRAKDYGVAPRPRVALVGLTNEEERELAEFFPTVHRISSLEDLPSVGSPTELDVIISTSRSIGSSSERRIATEYGTSHLILFGANAWLPSDAPGPVKGQRYHCQASARSTGFQMAADLEPRLARAIESSLPRSALGVRVIELWSPSGPTKDQHDNWLAWALDPRLPLAVNAYREPSNRGVAWFPYSPSNRVAIVKALVAGGAARDRESFPGTVDWAETREWMTREERGVLDELSTLNADFEARKKGFEDEKRAIEARAEAAKERADRGPRTILTTNDDTLVRAVADVFEDLGFVVKNVDDGREENAPKREDLQLRQVGVDDWVAIVEVKGHKKRGANSDDLTKIERHVRMYMKEEGHEPSLKMYICNSQFELPPDARERPYASNPSLAEHFADDPHVPGVVVSTTDLFRLHRDRVVIGLDEARRRLLAPGVFRY